MSQIRDYSYYKSVFQKESFPFAFVDLDLFEENIQDIVKRAASKQIRIASKSLRCVALIKRLLEKKTPFNGVMCYSVFEAVFLCEKGLDSLLVAYPTLQEEAITKVCEQAKRGKKIILMVDSKAQVHKIAQIAKKNQVVLPLCLDIDMSSRFPFLHFGVYRSEITTAAQLLTLCDLIQQEKSLAIEGIMGYEAQIAGVPDKLPGNRLKNMAIYCLKKKSVKEVKQRRNELVQVMVKKGISPLFVNGGGTGSLETTTLEDCVTEVTVGSGFFSPSLFDHYHSFKQLPAAGFAVEITRNPGKNIFTCHGGGYIASGAIGPEKLPIPFLLPGAKLLPNEGAGEVQTPFIYQGNEPLNLGDPFFMRHSKAGELCERFNELLLVSAGKIVERVKTYRGEGKCFL